MWDFPEHAGYLPRTMERKRDRDTGRQRQMLRERETVSKVELILPFMILTLEVTQNHLDHVLLMKAVMSQ